MREREMKERERERKRERESQREEIENIKKEKKKEKNGGRVGKILKLINEIQTMRASHSVMANEQGERTVASKFDSHCVFLHFRPCTKS